MITAHQTYKLVPFTLIFIVFILGANLDIMEVDALQYASISKEMVANHSYLQVYELGNNYLDKPPLLFWITSIFFNIFGAGNLSYRLTALFATVIAGLSTYFFAKKYYGKDSAYMASLILVSSQAYFLTNSDLRTDSLLVSFVILAVLQISEYLEKNKSINFILAFVAIGFAMLAKGPLGLVVPIIAVFGYSVLNRNFSWMLSWKWLLGILIVMLMLLPMSIGLYQQFGWDGIYFYFWLQSFGRITGENTWSNNPDTFFLVHSFLWSFLPWTLFIIFAFIKQTKLLIKSKFRDNNDGYTYFAFLIPFFILSLSKYQLPHYIYVVLPFAAILSADYININLIKHTNRNQFKFITYFNLTVTIIILVLIIYISTIYYTKMNFVMISIMVIALGTTIYYQFFGKNIRDKVIWIPFTLIICLNFFLYGIVYPDLFKYQASSVMGRKVKELKIQSNELTLNADGVAPHGIYFYGDIIPNLDTTKSAKYLITKSDNLDYKNYKVIDSCYDYHISKMTLDFLNPKTRYRVIEKVYLVEKY